jgi:hypothetical protein
MVGKRRKVSSKCASIKARSATWAGERFVASAVAVPPDWEGGREEVQAADSRRSAEKAPRIRGVSMKPRGGECRASLADTPLPDKAEAFSAIILPMRRRVT